MIGEEETDNSVTQCMCGHDEESEFMIQCERCSAWQHGDCVGVTEESLPEKYTCYGCVKSWAEYDRLGAKPWQPGGRLFVTAVPQPPLRRRTAPVPPKQSKSKAKAAAKKVKQEVDAETATNSDDKRRHMLMSRAQRGILRDMATVRKCLTAIRQLLNKLVYDRSASAAGKIVELEAEQDKCNYFLDGLMQDSDALWETIKRLQRFDDPATIHRAQHAVSDDDDEVPDLTDATAELNRLCKKYDARQEKFYADTENGKVLR
jgi:hypothetical protein